VIDLRRREGRPLQIGHRAALALENTIASLALALELGCDLVEFDVLEVDGALVLAHSPKEVPAELSTLDEALEFLAKRRRAQLDLKTPGAEADVVEASGATASSSESSSAPSARRACGRSRHSSRVSAAG
jgi:glycerophosphoryl diester phosphodiesterase